MVQYCMFIWTKGPIRPDNLFWPQYGSYEGWLCQVLKLFVSSREPFNQEESNYAAHWVGSGGIVQVFKLTEEKTEKKPKGDQWDPLEHLPTNPRVDQNPMNPIGAGSGADQQNSGAGEPGAAPTYLLRPPMKPP